MKRKMFWFFSVLALPTAALAGPGMSPAVSTATTAALVATADRSCRALPGDFSSPPVAATSAPASLWQGWQYSDSVTLAVTPATALVDQPVAIRVSGLEPGAPVTLRTSMKSYQGTTWIASATFVANKQGMVNPTRMAPRYGSYAGVHAMGLVWSMLPEGIKNPATAMFYLPNKGTALHVTALAGERVLVTADVARLPSKPGIKKVKLDSNGLAGVLYMPAQPGPHPAVIVLGGSEGGLQPQVAEAALLASHGYAALGLAYFQGYATKNPMLAKLPKELVKIPLEYFEKAADWLLKQSGVAGTRVGILGWSKGAEAALLLASTYPQTFDAVVAFAPTSVVWSGIHYGPGPLSSSWTVDGQPVPFLSFSPGPGMFNRKSHTIRLRDGYLTPLLNETAAAGAAIPVERIRGPVLLVSGTNDQIWPSSVFAHQIMTRLHENDHAYGDESLCYRGAGHYILWPYRPTITTGATTGPMSILFGGNARAYAFADADSWPRVLAFLDRALPDEEDNDEQ